MSSVPFPAFIKQADGIVTISNGTITVIFENYEDFMLAVPDFDQTYDVINYEQRPNGLLHMVQEDVGNPVNVREISPVYDAIIADIARLKTISDGLNDPLQSANDPQAVAKDMVDMAAENERAKYITLGSGQAMVYQQKELEATQLINDINQGVTIVDNNYPHLAAEIGTTGPTVEDVANVIVTMAQQWRMISAQIEGARLKAKADIDAETDPANLKVIVESIVWPGA